MTKSLLLEIKELLSDALNSEKTFLRQKLLRHAMELVSELEMDDKQIEDALKAELKGDKKKVNAIINKVLNDIDLDEYSDVDEKDFKKTYTKLED